MRVFGIFLFIGLMTTAALAAPIDDVPAWAQRFTQAALKTDADALVGLLSEAAAPGFNVSGMPQMLQSVKSVVGDQSADFAEQFDEKNVGTFLKKINIAVSYPKIFMFYSVIFGRHAGGWYLYTVKIDGNVNNIINMPWPG